MKNKDIMRCPACGKRLSGYKHFEGFMARLLGRCFQLCGPEIINGIKYNHIIKSETFRKLGYSNEYARVSDLRYWGLLKRERKWNHKGYFQITDKAIDFVRGVIKISTYVRCSQGKLIEELGEKITFSQAAGKEFATIDVWINTWKKGMDIPENGKDEDSQTKLEL